MLVDKPPGPSSHTVVAGLRRRTGARAGHAGTLDPFASGLLLVLLGAATRLAQFLVGLAGEPQRPAQASLAILGFSREVPAFAAPAGAPDPFAGDGTLGVRAAALSQSFLGVPYRWGGSDPIGGFDCSGFTMYVYGQLGIQLPHFTGEQLYRGAPVARDALLPGDLVFFDYRDGAPQHEGIYIGDGKFVHAPHTGDVVKVSGLDEAGYALSYYAAVRPVLRRNA